MKGEWHTLHRIEEVSNLIGLLREYEANTISRNAMVVTIAMICSILASS